MAASSSSPSSSSSSSGYTPVWWLNAAVNIGIHIASFFCTIFVTPWSTTPTATLVMAAILAQSGIFGVTMGYHRLWSHHAFVARTPLRIVLAVTGALGFQGSVRWWVIRHRLHHRYTDDPVHDPYAASKGLFYSHFGWIMNRKGYPRWNMIDKRDLDRDMVVQFQHKYFMPISLFVCFVLPVMLGSLWGDVLGAFVWGGLVARVIVWNSISFINSLAHWQGAQEFSDEMSARGDWFIAALTGGEGNHNFHAFPCDYRNGPFTTNWDPTRWIIWSLHRFTSLIPSVHRTPDVNVIKARLYMVKAEASAVKKASPAAVTAAATASVSAAEAAAQKRKLQKLERRAEMLQRLLPAQTDATPRELPTWGRKELEEYVNGGKRKVLLIEGQAIDVTSYLKDHPGGATILHEHLVFKSDRSAVRDDDEDDGPRPIRDVTQAFLGKFNGHTWNAREMMKERSVATIALPADDVPEFL